ncbi:FtsQ-type POTRA domain-containing protein [Spiractinospora alimapuensis]|nr:FtsQ-type POTRA domain-containing protein [Spiractinospora alimapuensis]
MSARRRSNPWKLAFVLLLTVGVLAAVVWILLGSRLLVVRDIEVSGTDRIPEADVVDAVAVEQGTPLARVDTDAASERAEELRLAEEVVVRRGWPTHLRVEVTEREPVLSVRADDGYQLVDADGVRIEDADDPPSESPLVTVRGEIEGNTGVAAAAAVTGALPEDFLSEIRTIDATEERIELDLASGARVVWGSAEGNTDKARVLAALTEEHPAEPELEYDVSAPDVAVVR